MKILTDYDMQKKDYAQAKAGDYLVVVDAKDNKVDDRSEKFHYVNGDILIVDGESNSHVPSGEHLGGYSVIIAKSCKDYYVYTTEVVQLKHILDGEISFLHGKNGLLNCDKIVGKLRSQVLSEEERDMKAKQYMEDSFNSMTQEELEENDVVPRPIEFEDIQVGDKIQRTFLFTDMESSSVGVVAKITKTHLNTAQGAVIGNREMSKDWKQHFVLLERKIPNPLSALKAGSLITKSIQYADKARTRMFVKTGQETWRLIAGLGGGTVEMTPYVFSRPQNDDEVNDPSTKIILPVV